MDLLLWRHAEAEELADIKSERASDLDRALTPRGDKQAAKEMSVFAQRLEKQLQS